MNNNLFNNYNQNFIPNNYVEEYLRNNIGKKIKAYVSFSDSIEWRDIIFSGILEKVGKDFIVINDDNIKQVIWCVYIDYAILE